MEPKPETPAAAPSPSPECKPSAPAGGPGAPPPLDADELADEDETAEEERPVRRAGPDFLRLALGILVMAAVVLGALWVYDQRESVLSAVAVIALGTYLAVRASGLLKTK